MIKSARLLRSRAPSNSPKVKIIESLKTIINRDLQRKYFLKKTGRKFVPSANARLHRVADNGELSRKRRCS